MRPPLPVSGPGHATGRGREEQDRRLAERARATGRTKSDLIREAVDRLLDQPLGEDEELARFRTAAQAAFGIAPYLEDGATYVRRLRDNDRGG
jgi:hypothetical protein